MEETKKAEMDIIHQRLDLIEAIVKETHSLIARQTPFGSRDRYEQYMQQFNANMATIYAGENGSDIRPTTMNM